MIEASVIGWPIKHSRSPLIHNYWLKLHGIQGHYTAEPVEPESLQDFINSLRHGRRVGCNVTIPHKESAVPFVDLPDERVKRIGALNTIWREDGKLHATSTDGPGFLANLYQHAPYLDLQHTTVTLLGAGGSARSLLDELLRQGAPVVNIYNRTEARAQALAQIFGPSTRAVPRQSLPDVLRTTDLLINTTAAGMAGQGELNLPWSNLKPSALVADIVYTPLITAFLQHASARGHRIVPGLGMLLHQAVVGFEKWFGVKPAVTPELHNLVARDIDPGFMP